MFASQRYIYNTRPVQLLAPAFESVGKLSLTNYLLQTIICTTVFMAMALAYMAN